MRESHLATEKDFPPDGRGFGCVDCGHQFSIGEEYVSVLVGMVEDVPLTEVKCPKCASDIQESADG